MSVCYIEVSVARLGGKGGFCRLSKGGRGTTTDSGTREKVPDAGGLSEQLYGPDSIDGRWSSSRCRRAAYHSREVVPGSGVTTEQLSVYLCRRGPRPG